MKVFNLPLINVQTILYHDSGCNTNCDKLLVVFWTVLNLSQTALLLVTPKFRLLWLYWLGPIPNVAPFPVSLSNKEKKFCRPKPLMETWNDAENAVSNFIVPLFGITILSPLRVALKALF